MWHPLILLQYARTAWALNLQHGSRDWDIDRDINVSQLDTYILEICIYMMMNIIL